MSTEEMGVRIKLLRMNKGMTQQELADELGVKRSTIGMYEQGQREPDMETIDAIADVFNVPSGYVAFGGEGRYLDQRDSDRLEALHQNPRLGMLFDRQMKMKSEDVDFMLQMAERIMKERDGED